jgi:hypothetical protein
VATQIPVTQSETQLKVNDLSGAIQRKTTNFLKAVNEIDLAINADFGRIGGVEKIKGYEQLGNTPTTTSLLGIHGYNKADDTEKLIAVWDDAPYVYNSSTEEWDKASVTLTDSTKAEFRTFLNYAFMVNGVDSNYSYDGTTWSTSTNLSDSPKGYFIERYDVRLYLGKITIGSTSYFSRVWFSDLPKNNAITWGLETGSDLAQTEDSATITSAGSLFKTRNIKVGDPFTITSGDNAGEYTVQSIDSETQITLTATLANTAASSSFWVGGNWFDVETDDGDTIKCLTKNSDELIIFKRNTLHRYSVRGQELRQVKGAVGTTAQRSVANIGDYTYYYHPSGIYRYNGVSSSLISNAVEDFIEGVTDANQTEVIAWVQNEKIVNFYLGDITLRDGKTISDCVVSFNTMSENWSARSYPFVFKAATTWLESNVPAVYVGDDASHIFKLDTGTSFDDSDIPFELETKPYFPAGEDVVVNFERVRVWIESGLDVQLLYKFYYKPTKNVRQWINDADWKPMRGSMRSGKSEWEFPQDDRRASGVALKFIESSADESFLIEKFVIYYSNPDKR